MLKTDKSRIILISAFLLIELTLLALVQTTGGEMNDLFSYLVVVLSAIFLIFSFQKTKSYLFTQVAAITTILADLFLVVIDPMIQLPAMIFFSGTQICYFLRLYFETDSKKEKRLHLIFRVGLSLVVMLITVVVLQEKTDALSLVSMFNYTNLILNVVFAFVHFNKSKALAIGLLLFLLCDTVIGLDIMAKSYITGQVVEAINSFLSKMNWAWLFYVPSQALLAISLIKLDKQKSSM
jgi:hypothetical protein